MDSGHKSKTDTSGSMQKLVGVKMVEQSSWQYNIWKKKPCYNHVVHVKLRVKPDSVHFILKEHRSLENI